MLRCWSIIFNPLGYRCCQILPLQKFVDNKQRRSYGINISLPDSFCISRDLINLPTTRLKSRKPLWLESYLPEPFKVADKWKLQWQEEGNFLFNSCLITHPEKQVPGFDLPRNIWVKLNRLETLHGRCNGMLYKWSAVPEPSCTSEDPSETIIHIVNDCPLTKFQGGFEAL